MPLLAASRLAGDFQVEGCGRSGASLQQRPGQTPPSLVGKKSAPSAA